MTVEKIGEAIVKGPVTYATQGGFIFDRKTQRVHFNAGLWREMCLLGHWISDTILFRWADLCVDLSGKKINAATVLGQLIVRPETERDVCDVRKLYQHQKNLTCVWTQTPLQGGRFDVDHIIPFALWHNNDLWNLLPSDSKVNNEKRDKLVSQDAIRDRAFKTALPIVGRMAAGPVFDRFATGSLEWSEDLDWVEVPDTFCGKNRFVVQVDGDSMEPLFQREELLVFEYHRTPRHDGQIVIAADFTMGGAYAVKRFKADPTHWCFISENPDYDPILIPKDEMPQYPILGTFVGKV